MLPFWTKRALNTYKKMKCLRMSDCSLGLNGSKSQQNCLQRDPVTMPPQYLVIYFCGLHKGCDLHSSITQHCVGIIWRTGNLQLQLHRCMDWMWVQMWCVSGHSACPCWKSVVSEVSGTRIDENPLKCPCLSFLCLFLENVTLTPFMCCVYSVHEDSL